MPAPIYWRTSDQKHWWLAAVLLGIEPRLRKVKGYRYLPQLKAAIQSKNYLYRLGIGKFITGYWLKQKVRYKIQYKEE